MNVKSTVAVWGTLRELHEEPIEYDLASLSELIAEKEPDLLCVEIGRRDWEARDFDHAPVEYREALLPLAEKSDIVIVPIDDVGEVKLAAREGAPFGRLRNRLIVWLQELLSRSQRWGVVHGLSTPIPEPWRCISATSTANWAWARAWRQLRSSPGRGDSTSPR